MAGLEPGHPCRHDCPCQTGYDVPVARLRQSTLTLTFEELEELVWTFPDLADTRA
jgi:hypothetical protein